MIHLFRLKALSGSFCICVYVAVKMNGFSQAGSKLVVFGQSGRRRRRPAGSETATLHLTLEVAN